MADACEREGVCMGVCVRERESACVCVCGFVDLCGCVWMSMGVDVGVGVGGFHMIHTCLLSFHPIERCKDCPSHSDLALID